MRMNLAPAIALVFLLNACQSTPITGDSPAIAQTHAVSGHVTLVDTPAAYTKAAAAAKPGDTIILENGVWRDFDMLLDAEGAEDAPITVRAQNPGEVVLSGQSSLRLAGRHLVVSGLVFRDGYTPRAEVISFRRDSENLAFQSRVTQTVIEDYSNPNRAQRDIWVVMYGQNNVFDHNHLSGKLNSGPTMAVRLNTPSSQNNGHRISHNYFGPRPVFGANGGETLRIGTSHYSLTRSGTTVEHNYFDRCSGEVEIISSKSVGNVFRGNTFFQSRGTLTLRHGGDTLVEGNLFDGDGAPHTGGVRVINPRQTVRGNLFANLTGEGFSGALVIMNGVPNSPPTRYHQVDGAIIEDNVFDGIRRIELGEGSDSERSAVPINSVFRRNIVIGAGRETPFTLYDDMSGIAFSENAANHTPPADIAAGFEAVEDHAVLADEYGVARADTGVRWHPKATVDDPFDGGESIMVAPGPDALSTALAGAAPGDTLVLQPGVYAEAKLVNLQIPVTIAAADGGASAPTITFERPHLFVLSGRGGLRMKGVRVSGEAAPDTSGNSFISTTSVGGAGNHTVMLSDMEFVDFDVNRGFSVVSATKGTFYDLIQITRSAFQDVSGAVVKLDTETDDYGIHNAEYLIIEDSVFERIGGAVASVYRGGRDESTFGPHVWVSGSRFDGVGLRDAPFMRLHGVQSLKLIDNQLANATPADFVLTTGKPTSELSGNIIIRPGASALLTTTDLRN